MRRLAFGLLVALVLVWPLTARADTADPVDKAVAAFHAGNPVYVDPAAEMAGRVSAKDAAAMRQRIKTGGQAMFVAVLPRSVVADANGDPSRLPALLHQRSQYRGTFAVLVGGSFRAASTDLRRGQARAMAEAAFEAKKGDGPAAVLKTFVDDVENAEPAGAKGSSGAPLAVVAVVLLVALGVLVFAVRRRRDGAGPAERLKRSVRRDLDEVTAAALALQPAAVQRADAGSELAAALTRCQAAALAVDRAGTVEDVGRVARVVAEARYALDRTRAVLDGRTPPLPPPDLSAPGAHGEPPVTAEDGTPCYVGSSAGWYGAGWFTAATVEVAPR
jgi:hypothetical protein